MIYKVEQPVMWTASIHKKTLVPSTVNTLHVDLRTMKNLYLRVVTTGGTGYGGGQVGIQPLCCDVNGDYTEDASTKMLGSLLADASDGVEVTTYLGITDNEKYSPNFLKLQVVNADPAVSVDIEIWVIGMVLT